MIDFYIYWLDSVWKCLSMIALLVLIRPKCEDLKS